MPPKSLQQNGLIEHVLPSQSAYADPAMSGVQADFKNDAQSGTTGYSRMEQFLSFLILVAGLITLLTGAKLILEARSPVPMWDEWQEIDVVAMAPHHQPPISWLWSQHNEHRVVFYRLLLLADIWFFHGKHSISFWTMLAVQCVALALLIHLLWMTGVRGSLWRVIAGFAAFCLFCPSQWENFGWAFQISFLLPGMFLLAALWGMLAYERTAQTGRTGWLAIALSILAASLATFSNANGVVVWPALIATAAVLRLRVRVLVAYGVSGLVLIGCYLYHYVSPGYHSSPWQSLHHPLAIFGYAARFLGVVLPPWVGIRDIVALSTGTLGILAALSAALWVFTHDRWRKPLPAAMFGLMLFALATAFLAGLGRIGFGSSQAYQPRYQTYNLLFWFSTVTLWLLFAERSLPLLRKTLVSAMPVVMFLAAGLLFPLCLRAARLRTSVSEAAAVTLVAGVPDKKGLAVLYPDPAIPWRDAVYFRQQRLFVFSGSGLDHMGEPLASVYRLDSAQNCEGRVYRLQPVLAEDSLSGQDTDGLRVSGWAVNRPSGDPARSVVIAANGHIAGYAVGGLQPEVSGNKELLKKSRFVDWSGFARPEPGATQLDFYAVMNRPEQVCYLATVAFASR
jgi:hypothetical protein